MQRLLPAPDYATDPQFHWPWDKFGLPAEDLFTSLYQRFNTRPVGIQEPKAFHRDVVECANSSATKEEFYEKLAALRVQRIEEIDNVWSFLSAPIKDVEPSSKIDLQDVYASVMPAAGSNAHPDRPGPRSALTHQREEEASVSAADGEQRNLLMPISPAPGNEVARSQGTGEKMYSSIQPSVKRKKDSGSDEEESDDNSPWLSGRKRQPPPSSGDSGTSPPAL